MRESGEMRAMRMIAKHGEAVVGSATTEPGERGSAGRFNQLHPTVASAALTYVEPCLTFRAESQYRRWVALNDQGRRWCADHGIEVAG